MILSKNNGENNQCIHCLNIKDSLVLEDFELEHNIIVDDELLTDVIISF